MISQKQLDANRRNALRSTGPRTPQGKAAVSQADALGPRGLDRLSLQASDLERAFYRAIHEFQSLPTPPSRAALKFRENKPIPDHGIPRKLLI